MAPPAADRIAPGRLASRPAAGASVGVLYDYLVAPTPGRLEFAMRLALVCALTTLVTQIYSTPSPALTAYLAFFYVRPDRVTSVLMPVIFTLVITVVLGFVTLVAQRVVDVAAWRVGAMAAISFGLLFLTSASKLRPIGNILAMIAAYALDQLGTVPDGEIATRGLLYTWLFIATPAGVSLAVALLLAPSPRSLVQRALAGRLRVAAAVLRAPEGPAAAQLARLRRAGDVEILTRLGLAGMEHSSPAHDIAALRQATEASTALLSALAFALQCPQAQLPSPLRLELAGLFDEMAAIFADGGYPIDVPAPAAPADPLAAAGYAVIVQALARFAIPSANAAAPVPAARTGFLRPDAFSNPEHLRFAFKTTLAAMACFLTYTLLDWPGIHTCLITCYIVSLTTVADSVEKLALRLAGALAGAALGIATMVFVVPAFTSIGGLMAIVFVGALAGAWIAAGSPRIGYAGFQLAFAFFLCVVQGAQPAFDLTVARDRVIGILFGNAMVFAVSSLCWPVSVIGRIEQSLSEALRGLARVARAADTPSRRRQAAAARAALGTTLGDLEVAGYEPPSVRAAPVRLARLQSIAGAAEAFEPVLLIAAESAAIDDAVGARLERLADDGRIGPPIAPGPAGPMQQAVESRLRALEAAAAVPASSPESLHALA